MIKNYAAMIAQRSILINSATDKAKPEPVEDAANVGVVVVPLEAVLLLLLHPHGSRYHAHRRKCLSLEQKY